MFEKTGDTYMGFTVKRIRESEELHGRLVELTYDKTATEVCWLDNGEINKTFSIAFKTIPENSTGVFHILEHSVLCGSEKFPVKEPFVELIKSSLNTFLNAMTFQDKTMYPVCSRNDRDFLNLTEVYLDAVFAPSILTNPNIFYQEGRHIEQAEDGSLSYKGVVFNEMKGAMSSRDGLMEETLISHLFPDNCYGFNSGGDPKAIPDLTYEQFVATYKRFYHPSNARVYLDGAIKAEQVFSMIASYLCRFERSTALPVIEMQIPKAKTAEQDFAIDPEESLENKGTLTLAKIIGSWEDRTTLAAMSVLNDAVAGSNESPIKRAVLSSGLAEEMDCALSDYTAQPYFAISLINVADGKEEELRAIIRDTAKKMLRDGLDKEAIEASLNRYAYSVKDISEPQGLERGIEMLNTWLYGGDPLTCIVYNDRIQALRDMLAGDGYEKLLQQLYLDDSTLVVLKGNPSHTYTQELEEAEQKRLAAVKASWTEEDRQANALLNEKLLRWQQTPDSAEALATMPQLPLSEIGEDIDFTETKLDTASGVTVLYHPVSANGIVHATYYFDAADIAQDKIPLVSLLTGLLGSADTDRHTAIELEKQQKNLVGSLSVSIDAFAPNVRDTKVCRPFVTVCCSFLRENQAKAEELIREVLFGTCFNAERVKEKLVQRQEYAKEMLPSAGQRFNRLRVGAHYSAAGVFNELKDGYSAVRYLKKNALGDFDRFFAEMLETYEYIKANTLVRNRMTVSITSDEPVCLDSMVQSFPEGFAIDTRAAYRMELPQREGFATTGRVGFAVQGNHLAAMGIQNDGSFRVATHAASYGFLWNTVRVQGGAYGTGVKAGIGGSISSYSFRDPTPGRSLEMNGKIPEFLRELAQSGETPDNYIIATVGESEPLLAPAAKGQLADVLWFTGRNKEDMLRERREILTTDANKLKIAADMLARFAAEGAVCVSGSEEQLAACGELNRIEL